VDGDVTTMPDPTSVRRLRALFEEHGFRPRRGLGQTFLVDGNTVRKIVRAADLTGGEPVLEVGAGAGAVTRELTRAARRVVAIEIDPTLVTILAETVGGAAEVVRADVLRVDWDDLLGGEDRGAWRVVANLPYAVTGPAILRLLDAREWVQRFVIMVQHEVAGRLTAPVGSRARGMLSVLVEATCDVELVGHVPRTCFYPRPRVDSTVLSLTVQRPQRVPPKMREAFFQVVKAAFGARRKTLANALSHADAIGLSKEQVRDALSGEGIDTALRAEDLDVEAFLRLAEAVGGRSGSDLS
jgi:16S rRNA (adenine1518-N6/adenine1519-N6)-dimethyltransferase